MLRRRSSSTTRRFASLDTSRSPNAFNRFANDLPGSSKAAKTLLGEEFTFATASTNAPFLGNLAYAAPY